MRMEELSDSRFVKQTDSVEKYLLNVVQEYFKNNSNVASLSSKEYIIKRAVARMKEEMTYEGIGVLSVKLPDDETPRAGAVVISLEDLHGEPLISPKLSAFNVNFGTEQNTACEGNDPRLNDKRDPIDHTHEITEVIGLEGILSTLNGRIERVGLNSHEHTNKNVLDILVYTGTNSQIDLASIETLETRIRKMCSDIEQDIIDYKNEINNKITQITTNIDSIRTEINNTKTSILNTNKEYYDLSKKYTDDEINKAKTAITAEMDNLVTRAMLNNILDIAQNIFTLVSSMEFTVTSVIAQNNPSCILSINNTILDELNKRERNLKDCIIEAVMEYTSNNVVVYSTLPYIVIENNNITGTVQLNTSFDDSTIEFKVDVQGEIPDYILEARIIYNVYSKKTIQL